MADWNCNLCKEYQSGTACTFCDDGSEFNKMSNADRIRSMTDEELAEFLRRNIWDGGSELFSCEGCSFDNSCLKCKEYLKWLQSEAE